MLADDLTSQRVHKVLSTSFTVAELLKSVVLLLVEHLSVVELGVHIGTDLGLAISVGLLLICLIFAEHLL